MPHALLNLSLREFRLGLVAVSAVIVAAIFFAAIMPQLKQLQAANKEALLVSSAAASESSVVDELEQQVALNEEFRHRLQGDLASQPLRQVEAFVIGRLQRGLLE